MHSDILFAPLELKFADGGAQTGEVEGYGSVFNNLDSHKDLILPGAFAKVLANHKSAGTMPAMYVQHGPMLGGDLLPAGVWTDIAEDDRGLRLKGKISALNTDYGKRVQALVQDKALRGLSIGFRVGPGNSTMGKKAGEPRRTIKSFDYLPEVSLVTDPSNALATIDAIRSRMGVDKDAASEAVASAIGLHAAILAGTASAEQKSALLAHLQDAHEALTGQRMPVGLKTMPSTIREFETALREMGFSHSQAKDLASHGLKHLPVPSGEEGDPAIDTETVSAINGALAGFKLS